MTKMRAVVAVETGVLELNWLWLPTIVGMNAELKQRLEKKLAPDIVGLLITEDSLDHIHNLVVKALCEEFPYILGLELYLQALSHVQVEPTS